MALSEVNICEKLLGYILIIFVVMYIHFSFLVCLMVFGVFFVWFTLLMP